MSQPRPPQPEPYPGDLVAPPPGSACHRLEFRDALGRPMTGIATITGKTRHDRNGLIIPVAPVVAEIKAGVLEVNLPPDTYSYVAALRTVDDNRLEDRGTFTVAAQPDRA